MWYESDLDYVFKIFIDGKLLGFKLRLLSMK